MRNLAGLWIGVIAGLGCGLDASLKHSCRTDPDCAQGRVCVNGLCQAPSVDAGPVVDATDGGPAFEVGTTRPNIVFVTSQRYPLRFQPITQADDDCNQLAHAAGVNGIFRAWLSTAAAPARTRLQGARGWVRPDGAPFADTLDDLLAGRIFNPPLLDENGDVAVAKDSDEMIVTGTNADGENAPGSNCHEWRADRSENAQSGVTDGTSGAWTNYYSNFDCQSASRLYCFGVDQNFPVAPAPMAGKRAFITDATMDVFAGLAGADAQCAREASAAKIPGTFKAFLATSQASAASRFPSSATTVWLRLDGVPLNVQGTDLFGGQPMLTTLTLTSQRRYLDADQAGGSLFVFTGATEPRAVGGLALLGNETGTCDDWMGSGTDFVGLIASADRLRSCWWRGSSGTCSDGLGRIYCLEN